MQVVSPIGDHQQPAAFKQRPPFSSPGNFVLALNVDGLLAHLRNTRFVSETLLLCFLDARAIQIPLRSSLSSLAAKARWVLKTISNSTVNVK